MSEVLWAYSNSAKGVFARLYESEDRLLIEVGVPRGWISEEPTHTALLPVSSVRGLRLAVDRWLEEFDGRR